MKNPIVQLLFVFTLVSIVLFLLDTSIISLYTFVGALWSITIVGISFVIFIENRSPQSTLAWFLVLALLPVVGVLLYSIFGRSRWRRKKHLHRSEEQRKLFREILEGRQLDVSSISSLSAHSMHLTKVVQKFGGGPVADATTTKLLTNGEQTFPEILQAIEHAKHHIHIQYYIYRADEIGTQIRDALIKKANSGVIVRFLYDGLGSNTLRKRFLQPMKDAGIEIVEFDPIFSAWLLETVNYRNHRKIIIIDGEIGFTGGLNVGDEYLGRSKKFPIWRDSHLRIEGKALYKLQAIFLEDWLYASSGLNTYSWDQFMNTKYFPGKENSHAEGAVQIVASGPSSDDTSIRNTLLAVIASAKKSIWIATPYFIPDQETLTLLRLSALAGIDVRILYPGKSDSIISDQASQSYFTPLLKAGASIYSYKDGFMHAKIVLVDNTIATIGTANMDVRSFELNYEIISVLYESKTVLDIKHDFEEDFNHSTEIRWKSFQKRSIKKRILESLMRLISPLL
ncbi:cardiolipin synthase [Bacillus pseudomycoides]|uniref:cardiolipin synthase n=1 Tax=Bacillus pseudomycoides TaxID=64104 RepID=UPI000BF10228|nr:cardiolipin synthase [Bacillus pseudomycoides]PEI47971.1 cardiolipin synthase [Bacillus pseudomycoides]PEM37461.1 cardiolipin synthase [Bacillus pseudomycoides]PGA72330.1 cardiolipin synthase [Bacillus pseudomycoides]PGE97502.1 cardiolipin synthase [Bacillus pseudomycoides]PHE21050.1 cardiolipin synthase [Bacillus pseudomycoides]